MGVGQLSESDAVDALRLPFYSSSHPTGSHGWRNQFDLGNPDSKYAAGECGVTVQDRSGRFRAATHPKRRRPALANQLSAMSRVCSWAENRFQRRSDSQFIKPLTNMPAAFGRLLTLTFLEDG